MKDHLPRIQLGIPRTLCGMISFSEAEPKGVMTAPHEWESLTLDDVKFNPDDICQKCRTIYFNKTGKTRLPQEK